MIVNLCIKENLSMLARKSSKKRTLFLIYELTVLAEMLSLHTEWSSKDCIYFRLMANEAGIKKKKAAFTVVSPMSDAKL